MTLEQQKLNQLIEVFERLFFLSENTQLIPGALEPFYQAATSDSCAKIFSRENFYSSALHEIAHWCIAGKKRRQLDDFGYWYQPEGRSAQQQNDFEAVEVKPQAIEYILSIASKHPFHFSADNLSQQISASKEFEYKVRQQAREYIVNDSLPKRAQMLLIELSKIYHDEETLDESCLS